MISLRDKESKSNRGVHYKAEAIKAAKDLRYGDEVVRKIRKAKSSCEVSRIMATARKASTV